MEAGLPGCKRVAVQLDIPFKMYDFEKNIGKKWWITWSRATRPALRPTRTLCNQRSAFLLETALGDGADMIATGHYARIQNGQLKAGLDVNKDQSVFLYRVTEDALQKSLMPIGELSKPEVRAQAPNGPGHGG